MHADEDWQAVDEVLSNDMATVSEYLQTWKLNSALQKRCWQSSISSTRKLNVDYKSTTPTKPWPFAPSPYSAE